MGQVKLQILINILIPVLFGCLTAYLAEKRGRSRAWWFWIGALFGLLGFLILLLMPRLPPSEGTLAVRKSRVLPENQGVTAATASSPLMEKSWFYLNSIRQPQGPMPFSSLKSLWKDERITAATYVWHEGMENWKKIGDYPELQSIL